MTCSLPGGRGRVSPDAACGVGPLAVGDLRSCEVTGLTWSGNPAHLRSVAAALERAARGLEDYLVVRAPGGQPVAKMRVDYASDDDTGVFSQRVTMSPLQGLGIATMLISAGEQRVRARGLASGALGVEEDNPRARRLYQRLGYQPVDRQDASWEIEDEHGLAGLRADLRVSRCGSVTGEWPRPRGGLGCSLAGIPPAV